MAKEILNHHVLKAFGDGRDPMRQRVGHGLSTKHLLTRSGIVPASSAQAAQGMAA